MAELIEFIGYCIAVTVCILVGVAVMSAIGGLVGWIF